MVETLYRAAEDNRADISFCRVFKDRGDKHENVPLGFDDGTVFDREAIGRTLIPAMLSTATSFRFPATRRATCFGARSLAVTASARIFDMRKICSLSSPA